MYFVGKWNWSFADDGVHNYGAHAGRYTRCRLVGQQTGAVHTGSSGCAAWPGVAGRPPRPLLRAVRLHPRWRTSGGDRRQRFQMGPATTSFSQWRRPTPGATRVKKKYVGWS